MDSMKIFLGNTSLCLLIVGTISNALVIAVICSRKKLRSMPTFVLIGFSVAMEIVSLYFRNLGAYTALTENYVFENANSGFCKISMFFHCWTLQAASWILIAMAIERLLSVKLNTWGSKTFSAKKAIILSSTVILVFFCTNVPLCFSYDIQSNNSTTMCVNIYPDTIQHWAQAHTYIYSIIPSTILIIVNIFLIYFTIFKKSNIDTSSQDKQMCKSLNRTVIFLTLSFVLFTLPTAISSGYSHSFMVQDFYKNTTYIGLSVFRFVYHSLNLILLSVLSRQFSSELKSLLCRPNNQVHVFNARRPHTIFRFQ